MENFSELDVATVIRRENHFKSGAGVPKMQNSNNNNNIFKTFHVTFDNMKH